MHEVCSRLLRRLYWPGFVHELPRRQLRLGDGGANVIELRELPSWFVLCVFGQFMLELRGGLLFVGAGRGVVHI